MISFPGRGVWQRTCRRVGYGAARLAAPWRKYDIAMFHEFAPPPSGGGHQFLRALRREWERLGLRVEVNSVSGSTRACILNSYNFDSNRFRYLRREGCRAVHRVDGPLSVYRGFDDGTDAKIAEWNREFTEATVFQSRFSLEAHEELGLTFREPTVIPNAADPDIFYPPEEREELDGRRLRVVATSWSDNPNKGADVLAWLDQHLDVEDIDFTFVGRLPVSLQRLRALPPKSSHELAQILRHQDVYLAASRHDPCSNALGEALACGLPAVYRNSGGHPELVGAAGLPFETPEQIPELLEQIAQHLDEFRAKIRVPSIADAAMQYLQILGVNAP